MRSFHAMLQISEIPIEWVMARRLSYTVVRTIPQVTTKLALVSDVSPRLLRVAPGLIDVVQMRGEGAPLSDTSPLPCYVELTGV